MDDMGEYQLMSSDTVSHAYLIADDQLEQLVWMKPVRLGVKYNVKYGQMQGK